MHLFTREGKEPLKRTSKKLRLADNKLETSRQKRVKDAFLKRFQGRYFIVICKPKTWFKDTVKALPFAHEKSRISSPFLRSNLRYFSSSIES